MSNIKKYSGRTKALIRKRFEDDYDAIYRAYINPRHRDRLTPTQLRQIARWKFARQWMSEFEPLTDLETINALREEFGISQEQARIDIHNMKRLFTNVDKVNDEFEKVMYIESVKRLRKKAIELGDEKGYAVAARCDANLAKVLGFGVDKDTIPEPKIVQVFISTSVEELGLPKIENLNQTLEALRKKREEKALSEVEDVDYDEILDNPRNERSLSH